MLRDMRTKSPVLRRTIMLSYTFRITYILFYSKNNEYVWERTQPTCNKLKLTIIYKSYSRATVTSNFIAQPEEEEP